MKEKTQSDKSKITDRKLEKKWIKNNREKEIAGDAEEDAG